VPPLRPDSQDSVDRRFPNVGPAPIIEPVRTEIVMPKLSDTMEEGTILQWRKQVGDAIAAGEVIAEVETDKADMELEAAEGGVLSTIQVAAGESAAVGAVIAFIDAEGDGAKPAPSAPKPTVATVAPAPEDEAASAEAVPQKAAAPAATSAKAATKRVPASPPGSDESAAAAGQVKASAAARALAAERGVDLATLRGSGPAGRIVSEDVEAARAKSERPAADREPAPHRGAPVAERHQLSRMRQSIARRMSEAFRDIPHFSVTAEIDMSEAVRLKAALEKHGTFAVPVTYTHMVLKATARALVRHPRLNASYRDGALEVHAEVNLGMAVSVEDGLIVPVLRHADERSLADLAGEARRLVALTKQGRFASEDLSGGTFTVSNMGMLDIEAFTAVINPPQAAILAVGSIKPRAVVRDGAVVAAHTMFVTVSCDHRIIDGVMAGRFLEELKTLLENPIGLVVT
jgi:pyruvate dehydrogenase E2 component (dihydrolipoamide acetyltransferase)